MHSQISMLCDLMSWKKIKTNDYFTTKPSLQDGHGGVDTQCKESQKWSSIQNSLHNSRRNKNIASHWYKSRANHWSSWKSELQFLQYEIIPEHLWYWSQEGKIDSSTKWKIAVSVLMFPVPTCSNNKPNQKKQTLPKRTFRAPGNRAATKTRRVLAD